MSDDTSPLPGEPPNGRRPAGPAGATRSPVMPRPPRPFTGYDRERVTFERRKADLLARCAGLFVVVVGEEVEGPVETFTDAVEAGYRRFGPGPLYVRQVLAEEP